MTKVLIVGSCPLFNLGLVTILRRAGMKAAQSKKVDLETVKKQVMLEAPEIIFIDLDRQSLIMGHVLSEFAKVIIIEDPAYFKTRLQDVLNSGCKGFVNKNKEVKLYPNIVETILRGKIWLDEENYRVPSRGSRSINGLSSREKEITALVAKGDRNGEIAEKLSISEQTVKNHLHNIFDKLGISSRLQLAQYAGQIGEQATGV